MKRGIYEFDGPEWQVVDDSAKDLISRMLTPPEHRLSAEEVMQHPWILIESDHTEHAHLKSVNVDRLKSFVSVNKLKQAALQFIASQLSEDEISDLIDIFNEIDTNGDGEISLAEFRESVSKFSKETVQEIEAIFNKVDSDRNGSIDYTEFIAATMSQKIYLQEEKIY